MARDNAACNRAIRKAWARERELVLAGKGSRNWTPEQREQLITKGKVYDADGKAFIGQHMKSVSGFLIIKAMQIIFNFSRKRNTLKHIREIGIM
ncbi:MAG: hypothetical protein ACLR1R_10215 [Ruminococcus callidus]